MLLLLVRGPQDPRRAGHSSSPVSALRAEARQGAEGLSREAPPQAAEERRPVEIEGLDVIIEDEREGSARKDYVLDFRRGDDGPGMVQVAIPRPVWSSAIALAPLGALDAVWQRGQALRFELLDDAAVALRRRLRIRVPEDQARILCVIGSETGGDLTDVGVYEVAAGKLAYRETTDPDRIVRRELVRAIRSRRPEVIEVLRAQQSPIAIGPELLERKLWVYAPWHGPVQVALGASTAPRTKVELRPCGALIVNVPSLPFVARGQRAVLVVTDAAGHRQEAVLWDPARGLTTPPTKEGVVFDEVAPGDCMVELLVGRSDAIPATVAGMSTLIEKGRETHLRFPKRLSSPAFVDLECLVVLPRGGSSTIGGADLSVSFAGQKQTRPLRELEEVGPSHVLRTTVAVPLGSTVQASVEPELASAQTIEMATDQAIHLECSAAAIVEIRLVGPDGSGVGGEVYLEGHSMKLWPEGVFRELLRPGRHVLHGRDSAGTAFGEKEVVLAEGVHERVELALDAGGGQPAALQVQILTAGGAPVLDDGFWKEFQPRIGWGGEASSVSLLSMKFGGEFMSLGAGGADWSQTLLTFAKAGTYTLCHPRLERDVTVRVEAGTQNRVRLRLR